MRVVVGMDWAFSYENVDFVEVDQKRVHCI